MISRKVILYIELVFIIVLFFSSLYDKLFDRGYTTFSCDKRVFVSIWLSRQVKERIGIKENQLILFFLIDGQREKYLEYHREYVFKG